MISKTIACCALFVCQYFMAAAQDVLPLDPQVNDAVYVVFEKDPGTAYVGSLTKNASYDQQAGKVIYAVRFLASGAVYTLSNNAVISSTGTFKAGSRIKKIYVVRTCAPCSDSKTIWMLTFPDGHTYPAEQPDPTETGSLTVEMKHSQSAYVFDTEGNITLTINGKFKEGQRLKRKAKACCESCNADAAFGSLKFK